MPTLDLKTNSKLVGDYYLGFEECDRLRIHKDRGAELLTTGTEQMTRNTI